jgi:hypothetical protein
VGLASGGLLALSLVGTVFAPPAFAAGAKRMDIHASIHADPPQPAGHQCATIDGVQGLPFQNTATLGTAPGDTWHSVGQVVDTTCVYQTAEGVSYTGTETGTVTIDGCGAGTVVLTFSGFLDSPTSEQSFARLLPGEGTGDLKGVSGRVNSASTLQPDFSADGVLTGVVHCPRA